MLGAYERGERAISVPRLQRLARFYNVPVDQMLPTDEERAVARAATSGRRPHRAHPWRRRDDRPVTIDLTAVETLGGRRPRCWAVTCAMIQVQRGDFNGRMLTIRRDDLRAIACILDAIPTRCRPGSTAWASAWSADRSSRRPAHTGGVTTPRRSASTSTSRSAPHAATTARSPPGRPPPPAGCLPRRLPGRHRTPRGRRHAGGHERVRRRRHAVAGGARRAGRRAGRRAPGAGPEVTVECNPDDVTAELVEALRRRRRQPDLPRRAVDGRRTCCARSGRTHDPDNVARAVAHVRAGGFPTFNLDLIYGAAGETVDDWATTLEAALALDPPHVSAYALTVEPGTGPGRRPGPAPRRRRPGRQVPVAADALEAAGLA